ncbi:hypothetical protein HYH02_013280 [Chlamydomonas schloesseri]|uniref:DUF659 domain-containing protein n=1 Tax=Chlamydomonas schloesseri TaxID=2026947 RepID=A0A835SQR0_9CHLO|nr:hypothetical protein HYH02_013280 [Chlamydomonas schloesseri]|eukprot:KAG2431587.1 hypothetical protein HYH02_013280 [Chlamydomonas schloesseri]
MFSAASNVPGFKPPDYDKLRGPLLEEAKKEIQADLVPFNASMRKRGVGLCFDGWTDASLHPLINAMAVSGGEVQFLKAFNTEGATKDAAFYYRIMCEMIEEVGPQHVVMVATDNAPVCPAAGKMVEEKYPHIFWLPCTSHVMDLALEDLSKLDWVDGLTDSCNTAVKFIRNHQAPLSVFRSHSKLELLKPGETRFGTNVIMASRLEAVKEALQSTVVDAAFNSWRDRQSAATQATSNQVRRFLLNEQSWERIGNLVLVSDPFMEIIRLADSQKPVAGKMFWRCHQAGEKLKEGAGSSLSQAKIREVVRIWDTRYAQLSSPLYAAGYVLDPEFWDHNVSEAMEGFTTVVERMLDPEAAAKAMVQLSAFRNKQGIFGRASVLTSAKTLAGHEFWEQYGGGVSELQRVAVRVLSMTASATSCERNWSTYGFIHNPRRNKLTPKRAQDLVYVFTNLRLRRRVLARDYQTNKLDWEASEESEADE